MKHQIKDKLEVLADECLDIIKNIIRDSNDDNVRVMRLKFDTAKYIIDKICDDDSDLNNKKIEIHFSDDRLKKINGLINSEK